MNKDLLRRWCDGSWLYAVYALGILMLNLLIIQWNVWDVPQNLMCMLSIFIPLHIFEENTYPAGFFYGNNLGFDSKNPRVYPQNMLTNMITNLGAEIVFVLLTFYAARIEGMCLVVVILFGIIECLGHTRGGINMYRRFKEAGKKTIYDPGLITSYIGMLELSTYTIYWITQNSISKTDIVGGVGIVIGIVVCLILIPFAFSLKIKSKRFAFTDIGYYSKYEKTESY